MDEMREAPADPGAERVQALENRLAAVERRMPRTNLINESFLRRSFTVWGHYFVANFLIGIVVSTLVGFVVLLVLLVAAILN